MRCLSLRLLRLPGAAAELVEQALLVAVARQELDVLDRQVEPVAAGVFEGDALVRGAHRGDGLEALVAADAVVDVDDEIARGEAGGLGQEVLGALAAARGADQPVAEDVLLGDDGEAGGLEAVLERPDGEAEAARLVGLAREVGGLGDRAGVGDAAVGEEAGEAFAGAGGVARDDDVALAAAVGDVGGEGAEEADLLLLALGGEVAADAPAGVDDAGAERLRQGAELVERAAGGGGVPGGVVEVERGRGHRLVDGADLRLRGEGVGAGVVLVGERGPARGAGGGGLVVEEDGGAGEIVEERLQPLVEEGEPVLGALDLAAGA